jgi:putative ABC transport system substrate-binding protein
MRRRDFIAVLGGAAAWPLAARAQQPLPVIGFLNSLSLAQWQRPVAAFRRGLNETGYVEGENVAVEYRWAENQFDRLPELAADLIRRQVAVIVTSGGDASALAAQAATKTTPIVFLAGGDPVKAGLTESLGRPSGNATGVTLISAPLEAKRIELLRELVPNATAIAALVNPNNPRAQNDRREVESAAAYLGMSVHVLSASTEADLDNAFRTFVERRAGALLIASDPFFNSRHALVAAMAARHAVPTIYPWREFAVAGGLITYGTDLEDIYRKLGVYTGKILKGARPAELPVEQPTSSSSSST